MKKLLLVILSICLACCAFVGCNTTTAESNIQYVSSWVSNSYTDLIPKPPYGDVYYVIDESEDGSYTIALNNLTVGECTAYINTLPSYGFAKDDFIDYNVSSSAYFTKDDFGVTIIYDDGVMSITISAAKQQTIG